MSATAEDLACMDRALALAEHARGHARPNPAVGCVVTQQGTLVGEGWTQPPGGPHAEVVALERAGARARGATAFVTLEPCDHAGRTGPCTRALIDAGVARVVIAAADPDPIAAGGRATLEAAGIDVTTGLRADVAREQNAAFLHPLETGRPLLTVKLAVSLDGRIAAADGTSQWLTGSGTRQRAHRLRADCDAVVVGAGTVLTDDPRLTVRLDESTRQPLRVVLDRRARTAAGARVYDDAAPSLAIVGAEADAGHLVDAGVGVARLPAADGDGDDAGDLLAALAMLGSRGVQSALLEGGARLVASSLAAGCADRLAVHIAPVWLGDDGRPGAVGLDIRTLSEAPRFGLESVARVGDDAVLHCRAPAPVPDPGARDPEPHAPHGTSGGLRPGRGAVPPNTEAG
ncbi:bifunctional diaminohydroxyphosphoribosylaminopyrimidine deaminase/5-amino-6-(5-phosphoribosylamino)uracil reductase RibD [Egibacter rhizosphaerae]|uniref:Riboflavin biosynthesis protein RibD n=1 Tax=Egibacter rhizosphaerae TaxID=1670831 RepID=A0A411YK42_9ACTN|nr:bifunctional diaminohydroxyphosphoribosylaminopyrimidine deaminase/5-amino-6-(5-phosphoribosylamino)uracil reductase RibD [Egibacter rhizosphaerae]QBI21550.1 bifunctional diaminohydroxyphosphoribosylaminopyrimidine deaminase/5-amino-6-(5-phosphoribosylamino)uracil reductase RibD [Egibacter rhizosphaerae]